jgi:hypothetical protein
VFSTRGAITELAVDGNRVAVATTISGTCGRVVVWTPSARTFRTLRTLDGCGGGTIAYRVFELALAGGQVAWLAETGGNSLELLLHAGRVSDPTAKQIEHAINGNGGAMDPRGEWVGQLLGGGALLAYNRWTVLCDPPQDYGCEPSDPTLRLANQQVVRIVSRRPVVLRRGPDAYRLAAVGGGRMAVETDGAVTVRAASGSRLASVPAVAANPPRGVALSSTRLAVARRSTLDLHAPASGIELRSIPLGAAAGLQLAGVTSRLALLRGPRRLVLVRLDDGKLFSLPLRSSAGTRVVDARLSEAGLFYAYNVPRASAKGRIVFEPSAALLARF